MNREENVAFTHNGELLHYTDKLESFAGKQMGLETIMSSGIYQTHKLKHHIVSLMW